MQTNQTIKEKFKFILQKSGLLHNNLLLNAYYKYKKWEFYYKNMRRKTIVEYPFGIFNIELTNKCPMKCIMCARTYAMTREEGFMDFNIFKKAINEFVEVNPDYSQNNEFWLHHFGESLLHPEFDKFINYASIKNLNVSLSLNPIMLNQKNAIRLILSKPFLLYLSLDGHDDDSFFKIRGMKNAYNKSKSCILNFLELKKQYKADIITTLSMIGFKENEVSIENTKEFWENQESLDNLLIKGFTCWDGSIKDINDLDPKAEKYDKGSKNNKKVMACNYPWETMTITWDGDVVPCCFDYDKKYVLGTIKNNTLSEIWNGKRMRILREELINNEVNNPLCKNCKQFIM